MSAVHPVAFVHPTFMEAQVWRGRNRLTPVWVLVAIDPNGPGGLEYGTCPCPECEGTGWWAYAEPEVPGAPCVECKGTASITVLL